MSIVAPPVEFRPDRPEYLADPFPLYRRMQDEDPAHWSPRIKSWVLTRYDDIKAALSDPETFSSSWGAPRIEMKPPIAVDPPTHRDYRLLLNRFFSFRSLEPHEDRIREIANRQIDRWIDRGEVEFVHEFGAPYTAMVLAE